MYESVCKKESAYGECILQMLLKHLCIQKTESKQVIVGTLNTKTNSCVTLVPTEKACSSAQKTKNDAMFWKLVSVNILCGQEYFIILELIRYASAAN